MRRDLNDKVALVTGSSSGIGAPVAAAFAALGASMVVNSASSVDAGLHPGDTIETWIEGVGTIRNRIVAGH